MNYFSSKFHPNSSLNPTSSKLLLPHKSSSPDLPNPLGYNLKSNLAQRLKTLITPRIHHQKSSSTPGPGYYSPTKPQNSLKYSIGQITPLPPPKSFSPGPAAYNTKKLTSIRNTVQNFFRMGTSPKDCSIYQDTPGPGTYQVNKSYNSGVLFARSPRRLTQKSPIKRARKRIFHNFGLNASFNQSRVSVVVESDMKPKKFLLRDEELNRKRGQIPMIRDSHKEFKFVKRKLQEELPELEPIVVSVSQNPIVLRIPSPEVFSMNSGQYQFPFKKEEHTRQPRKVKKILF